MVYFDLTFEYVLFTCFCVSMPLYFLILINLALVRKNDPILGTSFFHIVLSTGIADVITAIQTYAYFKIRFWGWAFDFYAKIHPVFKYELLIGFATTFAQSIGTLLIAFNRYTAMAMPIRHAIIWSPERVRIYLLAQWIIPIIVMIPGAFLGLCDLSFNKVPENGIAIVDGVNYTGFVTMPVFTTRQADTEDVGTIYQALTIVVWIIGAIITSIIYLILFFALRNKRHANVHQNQSSTRHALLTSAQEYRLLAYGIIQVMIQVTTATLQMLMILQGFNTWYRPQAVAVDAANYSSPYFLLLFSSALRRRCFPCCNKKKEAAVLPNGAHSIPQSIPTPIRSQLSVHI